MTTKKARILFNRMRLILYIIYTNCRKRRGETKKINERKITYNVSIFLILKIYCPGKSFVKVTTVT